MVSRRSLWLGITSDTLQFSTAFVTFRNLDVGQQKQPSHGRGHTMADVGSAVRVSTNCTDQVFHVFETSVHVSRHAAGHSHLELRCSAHINWQTLTRSPPSPAHTFVAVTLSPPREHITLVPPCQSPPWRTRCLLIPPNITHVHPTRFEKLRLSASPNTLSQNQEELGMWYRVSR